MTIYSKPWKQQKKFTATCILKLENSSLVQAHTKKKPIKLNSWHCKEAPKSLTTKGQLGSGKYHKHGEKIRDLAQCSPKTFWKSSRNPTENYRPHPTETSYFFLMTLNIFSDAPQKELETHYKQQLEWQIFLTSL